MESDGGDVKLDPTCELFRLGDPDLRSISIVSRLWVPVSMVGITLTGTALHNVMFKRPTFAGIQRFAIAGSIALMVGLYLDNKKREVLSEKDLLFYHYMTLHPEDFKPPDRIKYKDYLAPWLPIR